MDRRCRTRRPGHRGRPGLVSHAGSRRARAACGSGGNSCPGCRRAAGGDQRRQPVLRVRRPDQGHRQGRAARPRRGLPGEGPVQRGPGRQDGRPALPDREGAVRGGGRAGQGKSRHRRGRARQRPAPVRPRRGPGEAPVQPAEPGRPGQGSGRHRQGQDHAAEGGAHAGQAQSRLHRHPRADRRPHRPHRLHRRQSRQSGERHTGDHRQPGPDLCAVSGERARPRDHPRGASQGGRRADQDRYPPAALERTGLSPSRRLELHRSAGRPDRPIR